VHRDVKGYVHIPFIVSSSSKPFTGRTCHSWHFAESLQASLLVT
jgi:hypothetical protein